MNQMPPQLQQQVPQAPKELTLAEETASIENFLADSIRSTSFPGHQIIAPRLESLFTEVRNFFKTKMAEELARVAPAVEKEGLKLVENVVCDKTGLCANNSNPTASSN